MAKKLFEPVGDWIAVQRIDPATETEGGVLIPKVAQKKQNAGVVYATGPDATIEEGSKIVWQTRAGQEIEIGGESFLLLKPHQILIKIL